MRVISKGDPLFDAGQEQASLAILLIRQINDTLGDPNKDATEEEMTTAKSLLRAMSSVGVGLVNDHADQAMCGAAHIEASIFQLVHPYMPIEGVAMVIAEHGDTCAGCGEQH